MIWTVQPAKPEIRTRTRRNPRSLSTGSAMAATRAADPLSPMSRGSVCEPINAGSDMAASLDQFGVNNKSM